MSTAATQTDLITALTDEHREVEQIFSRLESLAGGTSEEAEQLARQLVISLVQHSVAEEIYLYPTVRERLPGGDELADQEVAEHDAAERTMQRLESASPSDEDFWPAVHELMREIRQHVHEEEGELFPRLRTVCSEEELRDLGSKAAQAEKIAPTRPHPDAPSEGNSLAALAPGAGLVDRARDTLSGRGG
jgi:hemerythrin-like domain-containing protein